MENRMIVRTSSNLSFSGERCFNDSISFGEGLLLKTSPKSEIKVWFPIQEIDCVILPDGESIEQKKLLAFLYKNNE